MSRTKGYEYAGVSWERLERIGHKALDLKAATLRKSRSWYSLRSEVTRVFGGSTQDVVVGGVVVGC